jgi:hypothetical protein
MSRHFEDKSQQVTYDTCRTLGTDRASEFYLPSGKRRTGANHRNAYFKGLDGLASTYQKTSMLYAAWAAGRDDRKEGKS